MASHFIGAKISLISRSEIRYKGTLVAIDHGAATISLQKVQSMGTEGRRGPDGPEIPISETNYDFIVFKAADVKNLTVEQPPPVQPQPSSNVPDDPAIVGVSIAIYNKIFSFILISLFNRQLDLLLKLIHLAFNLVTFNLQASNLQI